MKEGGRVPHLVRLRLGIEYRRCRISSKRRLFQICRLVCIGEQEVILQVYQAQHHRHDLATRLTCPRKTRHHLLLATLQLNAILSREYL